MIPSADYDRHPAFSSFSKRASADDGFANMNLTTDEIVDEFVLTGGRHRELIEQNILKYEELIANDTKIDQRLFPSLRKAVRKAHDKLIDEKRQRSTIGLVAPTSQKLKANVEKLYYQGYFSSEMPQEPLARMRECLEDDICALRKQSATSNGDIIFTQPSNQEASEILQDHCRSSGVFESLSSFFGRDFSWAGFVIHYSSPRDTWFRVFDDIGLPLAKTAQLHFDADYLYPKAMLYLNDVQSVNGAFSLVPRGSPYDNIKFDLAFGKELHVELCHLTKSEFDWTLKGNESVFRCPQMRELFVTLPHSLRRTSHAGDHLLDGSSLSEELLAREVTLDGQAGTMPVFVGGHTLHRGGLVTTGERIALQIVFYPTETKVEIPATIDNTSAAVEEALPGDTIGVHRAASIKKSFPRRLREAANILIGHG
jgi:hypothetical protein